MLLCIFGRKILNVESNGIFTEAGNLRLKINTHESATIFITLRTCLLPLRLF
jgi:hypothetical protein